MSETTPPPPPPSAPPPPPPPAAGGPAGLPGAGEVPPTLGGVFYNTGLNIVLAIVTCGIWTYVWTFRAGEDLKRYNGDGLGGVLQLVLAILLNPVVWFTIPNEIEKMYQRDGRESPVSTLWGLWFLLPIIGAFIWYTKVQRSLNDFWLSKGSSPA